MCVRQKTQTTEPQIINAHAALHLTSHLMLTPCLTLQLELRKLAGVHPRLQLASNAKTNWQLKRQRQGQTGQLQAAAAAAPAVEERGQSAADIDINIRQLAACQ